MDTCLSNRKSGYWRRNRTVINWRYMINKSSKDSIRNYFENQISNQIARFNSWKVIVDTWMLHELNINEVTLYFDYLIRQFNSTSVKVALKFLMADFFWNILHNAEEISIKNDAKKIKYYQISKNYCKLLANSLAMITKFL